MAFFCDESQPAIPTVRHKNCQFLLQHNSTSVRCLNCLTCRKTLAIQIKRYQSQPSASPTTPSSHVHFLYLSATQLAICLKHSQHQCRLASKQISCLQEKISRATVENGIVVDNEMHHGLQEIMFTETSEVYRKYKPNTFHHLFWKQQMDAASHQNASNDTVVSSSKTQV